MMNFDLTTEERKESWENFFQIMEKYHTQTEDLSVYPNIDLSKIRDLVKSLPLDSGNEISKCIRLVENGLKHYQVHVSHPAYFGLYNPRPTFPAILADALTAVFNPQLASWSHSPFANEVETYVVNQLACRLGFKEGTTDGIFTTGGAEANMTAVISALNHKIENFSVGGLIGRSISPTIYVSEESHHSIEKAASNVSLGIQSIRKVEVKADRGMDAAKLAEMISKDLSHGHLPLMVVATVGSTGLGIIDPIEDIVAIAQQHGLWLHLDGAWGGAVGISEKYGHLLQGLNQADSFTIDAHKWLAVPMGSGIYITKHQDILQKSFNISASYMPPMGGEFTVVDPYLKSIQWSRRFIGHKLYLSLLCFGWNGYAQMIDHQIQMGKLLRKLIADTGSMKVYNQTELPVVCFGSDKWSNDQTQAICEKTIENGKLWLSTYPIGKKLLLRACITNYNTREKHLHLIIKEVLGAMNEVLKMKL